MTTIMPSDDAVRKAVRWISEQRLSHPETSWKRWVQEAISRFDLNPLQSDNLTHFYRKAADADDAPSE